MRPTPFTDLVGSRFPIVQAPMAGGPSTPALAAAVSAAGGLGSIAAAMLSPDALREEIRAVRALTGEPFAVNVFAPLPPPEPEPGVVEAVQRLVRPHRERLGLPEPVLPGPRGWTVEDQLAVVVEERVPILSFTFGIPPLESLGKTILVGTATTVDEAVALERAGAHAVVAQGAEAGGHRGTFLGPFEEALVGTTALVPQVVDAVSVPVVAAGGVMDGRGIAAALALGAAGVQLGSAFLFCDESGAGEPWRQALREHETTVTAAYSGRPCRLARTPFVAELETVPPAPYPLQAQLLADLRRDEEHGFYLGGQAARLGRELSAGELVRVLVEETEAALR